MPRWPSATSRACRSWPRRTSASTDLIGSAAVLASQEALDALTARVDPEGGRLVDPSQVLIRPVVSEKSYVLAAVDKYTFRVHPDAHKTQIRQAIEVSSPTSRWSTSARCRSSPSPSGAASSPGARAVEEGRRPGARRATDPIFQGLQGLEG